MDPITQPTLFQQFHDDQYKGGSTRVHYDKLPSDFSYFILKRAKLHLQISHHCKKSEPAMLAKILSTLPGSPNCRLYDFAMPTPPPLPLFWQASIWVGKNTGEVPGHYLVAPITHNHTQCRLHQRLWFHRNSDRTCQNHKILNIHLWPTCKLE